MRIAAALLVASTAAFVGASPLLMKATSSNTDTAAEENYVVRPTKMAFDGLERGLKAWEALSFDAKFGFNVGDRMGTLYTFESEGFSMSNTLLEGASLSKWPAAVMISGLVEDGTISYTDKANKYLKYWEKEGELSAETTLESLLSFTSGLTEDPFVFCEATKFSKFLECAEKQYEKSIKEGAWIKPRKSFYYLSGHLQFAAAMASEASGMEIQDMFKKYLYEKFNMTKTTWYPLNNPSIAGGIETTGEDFEHLLQGLLTYRGLSREVCEQMEQDWTKAPVDPSGDGWFGHYGMGHWYECLGYGTPSERAPLPPMCEQTHVQAGPGEFGFYPLIDRSGGGGAAGPARPPYYMQVPLQEPDPLSGIPEYLRIITKPLVDYIMNGTNPETVPKSVILAHGAGLLRRDIDFIKSELGECKCSGSKRQNEPYATLEESLPEDHPKENRETLLRRGEGITLFELAAIQTKIGTCHCKSRK